MNDLLLALADDQLILGHYASEWCGHAPLLEEDIAFANLALDEIGHAVLWYQALAQRRGEDPETYPDRLAFFRPAGDFRCAQLVELPNRDWSVALLRQYLYDEAEALLLETLLPHPDLGGLARKIQPEEAYHLRHTRLWVQRLAQGTPESRRRMQAALEDLWGYACPLFDGLPPEGSLPPWDSLGERYRHEVGARLLGFGLHPPDSPASPPPARDIHSTHLTPLLDEMQSVARLNPAAEW